MKNQEAANEVVRNFVNEIYQMEKDLISIVDESRQMAICYTGDSHPEFEVNMISLEKTHPKAVANMRMDYYRKYDRLEMVRGFAKELYKVGFWDQEE